jgi:pimeloyl-ACP methyl ester carboxylesterase
MPIFLPETCTFVERYLCLLLDAQPSEENTYADIEAVYQCLEIEYGISQENLILYGQSVGSGPTLHLASRLPRLRGVVLHSAILSGLRVVCHVNFTFCFDIYKVSISN